MENFAFIILLFVMISAWPMTELGRDTQEGPSLWHVGDLPKLPWNVPEDYSNPSFLPSLSLSLSSDLHCCLMGLPEFSSYFSIFTGRYFPQQISLMSNTSCQLFLEGLQQTHWVNKIYFFMWTGHLLLLLSIKSFMW